MLGCKSTPPLRWSQQGNSDFPKVNTQRVPEGHQGVIRKSADRDRTLLFHEWTHEDGVPVLAIIAHVGGRLKFCIDVAFLEGKGVLHAVEHKTSRLPF